MGPPFACPATLELWPPRSGSAAHGPGSWPRRTAGAPPARPRPGSLVSQRLVVERGFACVPCRAGPGAARSGRPRPRASSGAGRGRAAQVGHADDRELKALGPVDRHQADGIQALALHRRLALGRVGDPPRGPEAHELQETPAAGRRRPRSCSAPSRISLRRLASRRWPPGMRQHAHRHSRSAPGHDRSAARLRAGRRPRRSAPNQPANADHRLAVRGIELVQAILGVPDHPPRIAAGRPGRRRPG